MLAWLCDPAVGAVDVTQANLQPPRVSTQIEADWLWAFLQRVDMGQSLLQRAQILAGMTAAEKGLLQAWGNVVSDLAQQFQVQPPAWPHAPVAIPAQTWKAFQELMNAFYEKGFRGGLPYAADSTPVTDGGVTYAQFVQEFRDTHRMNPNPQAREVCVLCGSQLDDIEVDHWIAQSAYPLLSVCADNLLPICAKCNSTDNKGSKAVHSMGCFADWFHPYLRHANGEIRLEYTLQTQSISVAANSAHNAPKVANLDKLLNLASRWTIEFKAEYAKQQDVLIRRERKRISRNEARHTSAEVQAHLQEVQGDLVPSEPNYEVHSVLCAAMLEQARLESWQAELGLQ